MVEFIDPLSIHSITIARLFFEIPGIIEIAFGDEERQPRVIVPQPRAVPVPAPVPPRPARPSRPQPKPARQPITPSPDQSLALERAFRAPRPARKGDEEFAEFAPTRIFRGHSGDRKTEVKRA